MPSIEGPCLPGKEPLLQLMIPRLLLLSLLCNLPAAATGDRLPSAHPSEVGMSAEALKKIDEVVTRKFIEGKQLAGASVLVARKGKVVHFGTYGMRDRAQNSPMERDTIVRCIP